MECTKKSVYTIVNADTLKRPLFRRIGVAFVNSDQSLSVLLDAFPLNGRLHIRDEYPKRVDNAPRETTPLELLASGEGS